MSPSRRASSRPRSAVSRTEFAALKAAVTDVERSLDRLGADLQLQFRRTAQLQAQVDQIQAAWKKLKRG